MQKSFAYVDHSFAIASNIYADFGVHIPMSRSFSVGENIPPTFPFYAGIPLVYHFFFDFTVALYEKTGIRIDYAFNLLSALSFAGVLALLFSLSQEMFGNKKLLGFFAVVLFLFNSSLSFLAAITKYWGEQVFSKLYHHSTYLGNGPFGESIVSVFWNLNTYLNQRHFLFALGLFLIIIHYFYYYYTQKKITFPWIFLGFIVGLLPFWHTSVFLAVMSMGGIIFFLLLILKRQRRQLLLFLLLAFILAFPQIMFVKQVQSVVFPLWHPGFLIADIVNLKTFGSYWFHNLGFSLLLIPFGVFFAKRYQQLFFIPILCLFLLPNLFQFTPQMFDNHKFLNMFIMLANIYTAFVLYLLWKKNFFFKIIACVLVFFLTFSGVIDFMVLKNDVKTQITDYPNNAFLIWIKTHTDPNAIFLTNAEMYDPITFVGRKSFLGRSHHLWTYGISAEERVKAKSLIFSSNDSKSALALLKKYHIDYIVFYKQKDEKKYTHTLEKELKIVYNDKGHLVLQLL